MSSTGLPPTTRLQTILLATDGSEYGAAATAVAITLAARSGGRLHAMSMAVSNDEVAAVAPDVVDRHQRDAARVLDAVRQQAMAAGVGCETTVRTGDEPAAAILACAEDIGADLIVMGRRGRRGLARLMVGDATARVVGKARCGVLVVPRAAGMWQRGIVVATDGSPGGDIAVGTAMTVARCCPAPVTVVAVVPPGHDPARAAEGRRAVEQAASQLATDTLPAEAVVAEGEPDTAIVDTARERGADLIVLGHQGRGGLGRALLGGVAERVIGQATMAVLVARGS